MRILRWAVLSITAVAVSLVALLWIETRIARSGPHVPDIAPNPPDSAAGPPGRAVDAVVWLGDSTAAGTGSTSVTETLPEQTANLLGRPIRLTNLAHPGDTVADVVRTQLPRLAGLNPTVVFISVGANDSTHLVSRAQFRRDYARMLAGLPSGVQRVVLLGVPDMGAPPRLPQPLRAVAGWRARALDLDVRHLAATTPRATYVDIAGKTGPAFRRDPDRYFAADHFHPNDAGYGLWARAVAAAT